MVVDDRPAMARGKISTFAGRLLTALDAATLACNPHTPRDTVILTELLTQLDTITQDRRTRLLLATGVVPGVLWVGLFAGAAVTLAFTFFFGSRSVYAQALMTGMLAAVIFMALFVIVEIAHPFTGPVSVGPLALQMSLETLSDTR